jgi:cysteine desulfurase/selenocysteine lyase
MIYLDNAATSFPKPEVVYQAMDRFARRCLANPGRAGHSMALAAERELDEARHALNRFFSGAAPQRWIFTLNGTDALNMAIKGILQDGDHVVTTDLEHNSVSRPLQALELAGKITLTRVASVDGYLSPEDLEAALRPNTSLVVMTHAANATGTVQPIERIAPLVRSSGALLLLDAAQTAGVIPIDLSTTPIDLLAFPGHKALYGPTGTGALYVGPRTDGRIRPWREGGTGGDSSSPTQPAELPYLLEGGTPNVLGISGLRAGLGWVSERGPEVLRSHEISLLEPVVEWAEKRSGGWKIAGQWDPAAHVGALSLIPPPGLSPAEVGSILDVSFDIAVRPGLHCAPYLHRALGTFPQGTLRMSPGPFSTIRDIEELLQALTAVTEAAV